MKSNPLEKIIVRLSKIEGRIAGTPPSQQPVGIYSDDRFEEIDLYLDGIEKGLDSRTTCDASNASFPTEMMTQMAKNISMIAEVIGDKETREKEREEDVEKVIDGISRDLPENAKDVVIESYNNSMLLMTEAKKAIGSGMRLQDPLGSIPKIEEFNANIKAFKSKKFGEDVERMVSAGVKNALTQEISSIHTISDTYLNKVLKVVAISLIAAFISGVVLVCSIIALREANEREQEAEENIQQANERMEAASKHLDFNLWVMENYPSLKDDFLKEKPKEAKAGK